MAFRETESLQRAQHEVLARYGAPAAPINLDEKVGVAGNVRDQELWPVNGLRHSPTAGTAGWYIWAGDELPEDPEFFLPLHARHLADWRPAVLPYLLLAPGWRFLIAPGYEDVWHDATLLEV